MMSAYKASIFNYIFNSINSIVVIVNGIVMVPIYFHYMSVSTYGAWLATGNVVAMLGLLESGLSFVITQKMSTAIAKKENERFRVLAGSNILSAIIISSTILLLGLAISPFITEWINIENDVKSDIRIAFIVTLIATCISIFINLFGAFPQVWQDTKQVGVYNTIANLLAIVSLLLFLILGCGVVSIALSYVVRSILNLTLSGSWIIRKWKRENYLSPIYSWSDSLKLMKDCTYPFLSKVSSTVVGNSQSFIIAHFMNPGLAAIYDLTSKICTVACGFLSIMNGSAFALFSLTIAEGNHEKTNQVMKNVTQVFFIMLVSVALYSICFTEPVMNYWLGLDKFGGTNLLVVIVAAKVLAQVRSYYNSILYTGGLINKSAIYDIAWMAMYLLILFIVIKPLEIYAIPVATLISCFLFIGVYIRMMYRELHIDILIQLKQLAGLSLIIMPFLIAHFLISPNFNRIIIYLCYFMIFSIMYIGVLYIYNRSFFIPLIRKFKRK